MRLARFQPRSWPADAVRTGAVIEGAGDGGPDDVLVDLAAAFTHRLVTREGAEPTAATALARAVFPSSMTQLLGTWERGRREAENLLEELRSGALDRGAVSRLGPLCHRRADVRLLAPVDPPTLRDFFAFEDHMKNALQNLGKDVPPEWYEAPSHYVSRSSSVFGPDEQAAWPYYTEKLDFELELAIVIGRTGTDLEPDDAPAYVAGLTIFNDLSCRDVQRREMGTHVGPVKTKSFDGGCGLGPYLVTLDELSWPFDAEMRAYVNDELWSKGRSGTIYWSLGELVAHASAGETLLPGDVLGSGTVGTGAGIEIGRWIQPNDRVRLEIDGLGALECTVVPTTRARH